MVEADAIISALRLYEINQLLKGQRLLITAGPTRESIDPVRFLSNHSSGKMGYALAAAARLAGAEVILVSGPTALSPPLGVQFHAVESAQSMYEAVHQLLEPGMVFIGTAAVADYHLKNPATEKIKKQAGRELTLSLQLNSDILASVAKSGKASYVVGFAAETSQLLLHAKAKLESKKIDMIIANEVSSERGFHADHNQVTILTKDKQIELNLIHKTRLAGQIIAILAATLQNGAHKKTGE